MGIVLGLWLLSTSLVKPTVYVRRNEWRIVNAHKLLIFWLPIGPENNYGYAYNAGYGQQTNPLNDVSKSK